MSDFRLAVGGVCCSVSFGVNFGGYGPTSMDMERVF